jgi:type IV pilus assembly protein PilB
MEYVHLTREMLNPEVIELIPQELILRHMVLPLGRANGRLRVVIPDPLDLDTLDVLRFRLNQEIDTALAAPGRIKRYIDRMLAPEGSDEAMPSIDEEASPDPVDELEVEVAEGEEDAPIIRLINMLIATAVKMRASDIHIEPMADRVRVRYRIDGVCVEREGIQLNMRAPMTTRLKIMAGVDIAERRLPQDGRIKLRIGGSDIDFRVSCLPAYHGESVVLRILRPDNVKIGIEAMGFEEDDYQRFQSIIKRPNGIFLVTGPTGSGKTTTLYGALQELNRPDVKIITAEDPVEYNFTGMNQCQVREDIGLTFSRILRSMLRQAPNVILVGEIRDREVGEVAIQAALTGHLVFSTLHTNDAPGAITRLVDMGIKPFLVASSIQAIMAQRLVRIICKECKQEDPAPDRYFLRVLEFGDEEIANGHISRGAGCAACDNTGYKGRLGIFEMMQMDSQLRELAFNRAPTAQIRKVARAAGMKSLMEDGKRKVLRGITTPEEIVRICKAESLAEAVEDEE